ncbi:MAG TPA: sulfite exporter TauE/SafE family protein, partial [Pyrinomonadaceae bacterium]
RVFASFAASSVPFAFLGGMIVLPTSVHKILLGLVLLIAAVRLAWNISAEKQIVTPSVGLALILGAAMGLLAGLTGVGGGIFLTPVLLLTNWTETKKAAGISAMFILVNSVSGLLGNYAQIGNLPSSVWFWIAAAISGGIIGSTLGSRRFNSITLRRVLSLVLVIAGLKLIFT